MHGSAVAPVLQTRSRAARRMGEGTRVVRPGGERTGTVGRFRHPAHRRQKGQSRSEGVHGTRRRTDRDADSRTRGVRRRSAGVRSCRAGARPRRGTAGGAIDSHVGADVGSVATSRAGGDALGSVRGRRVCRAALRHASHGAKAREAPRRRAAPGPIRRGGDR